MKLRIADNFALPTEAVTQTFAILAKRGAGKTYTAAVMAEEMLAASLPLVICDPIGVWWGLRASADGKNPGLPIVVIGGDHGDVPLDVAAGETIARMVVEERLQCVLDLSRFRKGEQTRFMEMFCEALYRLNRQPLHVFLDEADAFAPQRPMPGEQRLLGAIEDIVRRGRARGLGVTLITQRAAVLNKNVLTQIEVLVCLRTIAPQDRAAIEAWVEVHGTPEQSKQLLDSLPSLSIGTAWFWSPGWLDTFRQVNIRKRHTFDSSATPKVGTAPPAPKRLAEVDLAKLKERIGETIERAKAEDPRELRSRIVELQKLQPVDRNALDAARESGRQEGRREVKKEQLALLASWKVELIGAQATLSGLLNLIQGMLDIPEAQHPPPPKPVAARPASTPRQSVGGGAAGPPAPAPELPLPQMQRAILTALAQHPRGLSKGQILLHAGYASSGPVSKAFAELNRNGWTDGGGSQLRITDAGLKALGSFTPLPKGADLRSHLLNSSKLSTMEKAILGVIFDAYPHAVTKGEILRTANYASSGPVSKAFARLVRYGYAVAQGAGLLRANSEFYE